MSQGFESGTNDRQLMHVLLAEDIPAYLDRIISLFKHECLNFISVLDGQEAIDYIQDLSKPLDLLVTDMDMPRRTGWHVIESLRELRPEVPVIMQTGEAAYPWVKAQAHELSAGRFTVGLGTQVKGHNERRYGMKWEPGPATRMKEYIRMMRAVWDTFQTGAPPAFKGKYYQFTLVNPNSNAGPIDFPGQRSRLRASATPWRA